MRMLKNTQHLCLMHSKNDISLTFPSSPVHDCPSYLVEYNGWNFPHMSPLPMFDMSAQLLQGRFQHRTFVDYCYVERRLFGLKTQPMIPVQSHHFVCMWSIISKDVQKCSNNSNTCYSPKLQLYTLSTDWSWMSPMWSPTGWKCKSRSILPGEIDTEI